MFYILRHKVGSSTADNQLSLCESLCRSVCLVSPSPFGRLFDRLRDLLSLVSLSRDAERSSLPFETERWSLALAGEADRSLERSLFESRRVLSLLRDRDLERLREERRSAGDRDRDLDL